MSSSEKELRLLVVEDSEDDFLLLVREIQRGGYHISYQRVENEAEMRSALADRDWDLIIADYTLPQFSGPAALDVLRKSGLDIPLVIVSGTITDEAAVLAMRSGAKDYLMKGNLKRLVPVVDRELFEARERSKRRRAEENLERQEEEKARLKRETEAATRRFMRDTVYAVTEGKLNLVSYQKAERLCRAAGSATEFHDAQKIKDIRTEVTNAALGLGMSEDRAYALVTAAGEALVNAFKHAGGGTASVYCLDDKVRVCIRDHGEGIESLILPSVALMTRFSTKRSMGFGYTIILDSVDTVYLATGKQGTCVIMDQAKEAATSEIGLNQLQDVW
jgi:anti-sigma regulatory factor (Ser/Thr protein kinase)/FixJ family two-component response regulator